MQKFRVTTSGKVLYPQDGLTTEEKCLNYIEGYKSKGWIPAPEKYIRNLRKTEDVEHCVLFLEVYKRPSLSGMGDILETIQQFSFYKK